MAINTAQDLLTAELRDIYSAEKQLSRALPKISKAVSSDQLRDMIDRRKDQGVRVLEALDQIFQQTEIRPGRNKCEAMEGLIEEANEQIEQINDDQVLDAALVGALQRVEHYCIAAWGVSAALAKALGHPDAAQNLSDFIAEGRDFDQELTDLAESEINVAMLDNAEDDEDDDLEASDDVDAETAPQAAPRSSRAPAKKAAKSTGKRGEAEAR